MRRLDVRFRPAAQNDLAIIYRYVRLQTLSDAVAEGYIGRVLAKIEQIGDAPYAGRSRDDLEPGLRTWSFERRIVIAYRVIDDAVEITNILYGGRSIETLYRSLGNTANLI